MTWSFYLLPMALTVLVVSSCAEPPCWETGFCEWRDECRTDEDCRELICEGNQCVRNCLEHRSV